MIGWVPCCSITGTRFVLQTFATHAESDVRDVQLTLFTAAIILLLNIWGSKHTGSTVDTAKEMEDVKKALDMLRALEPR